MNLDPRWTAHIRDKDRKKSFEQAIFGSKIIADRLRVIVEEELKAIERSEARELYESPNWPCLQAHRNGYYRAMTLLRNLLDFNKT